MTQERSLGPIPACIHVMPTEITGISPEFVAWRVRAGHTGQFIRFFDARPHIITPLQQYNVHDADRKLAALKHLCDIANGEVRVSLVWRNGYGQPPFINLYTLAGEEAQSMLTSIPYQSNAPTVLNADAPKRWLYRLKDMQQGGVLQVSLTSDEFPIALTECENAPYVTLLGSSRSVITQSEYLARFAL